MDRIVKRQTVPGGPVTEMWVDDDRLAVHSYHLEQDLNDTIDFVKAVADRSSGKTPQGDGLVASIPPGLYWKWYRAWNSGPNQEVLWETYLMLKLNSSEFKNLRAYSSLPMPGEI